jgi:hypothetical protein
MFGMDFGEKCIIVQFLGAEKDGKPLNAEAQRKDLRREGGRRSISAAGKTKSRSLGARDDSACGWEGNFEKFGRG